MSAAFQICNQSLDIANVSIGQGSGKDIKTRGWWVVAPNRCATLVSGDLENRYVYIHAEDVRGRILTQGKHEFCLMPRQFEIVGGQDCWSRGFARALFAEIDTHDAKDWTLFLRPVQTSEPEQ